MRIECEWRLAPEHAGSEVADNQRTHVRHAPGEGVGLRLAVQPMYRGYRAVLYDISVGGVGLLMERPLEAGTIIAVDLRETPHEGVTRIARVAHVRSQTTPADAPWLPRVNPLMSLLRRLRGTNSAPKGECWFVGCKFDVPLSEEELDPFLGAAGEQAAIADR